MSALNPGWTCCQVIANAWREMYSSRRNEIQEYEAWSRRKSWKVASSTFFDIMRIFHVDVSRSGAAAECHYARITIMKPSSPWGSAVTVEELFAKVCINFKGLPHLGSPSDLGVFLVRRTSTWKGWNIRLAPWNSSQSRVEYIRTVRGQVLEEGTEYHSRQSTHLKNISCGSIASALKWTHSDC